MKESNEFARAREAQDPEPDFGDADPAAPPPVSPEPSPAHAVAIAWYRRYHVETGKLIAPSERDFLEVSKACGRMAPAILEAAIEPYFSRGFWFNRDKASKKPTLSFLSFLAHVEEIAADSPAKPRAKGWRCPHCGAMNTHTGGICMQCHEDREPLNPGQLAAQTGEARG